MKASKRGLCGEGRAGSKRNRLPTFLADPRRSSPLPSPLRDSASIPCDSSLSLYRIAGSIHPRDVSDASRATSRQDPAAPHSGPLTAAFIQSRTSSPTALTRSALHPRVAFRGAGRFPSLRDGASSCRMVPESLPGPDGEIGRRSGLKIRRPQGRGGSSPPPGTNKINSLNSVASYSPNRCAAICVTLPTRQRIAKARRLLQQHSIRDEESGARNAASSRTSCRRFSSIIARQWKGMASLGLCCYGSRPRRVSDPVAAPALAESPRSSRKCVSDLQPAKSILTGGGAIPSGGRFPTAAGMLVRTTGVQALPDVCVSLKLLISAAFAAPGQDCPPRRPTPARSGLPSFQSTRLRALCGLQ